MRVHLLILAVLCTLFSRVSSAEACTCLPPDMGRSYQNADHVVRVRIQRAMLPVGTSRAYIGSVVAADYKGCLDRGQRVVIETASGSASCGMPLQVGQEYLLHGARQGTLLGMPRLRVGLCDANVRWKQLTAEHLEFLETRYVCCGKECACADGSQPVNCFVDPCEVSSCNVEGAVCESNYCGGCNAEWYDPTGALVCQAGSACDYDQPGRTYVARDPARCAAIRFVCAAGSEPFFDECGCGCADVASVAACRVGGCSGQLCVGPDDPGISTCEWRDEYACYRTATCEVQSNGSCGWTPTPELLACLDGTR